MATIVQHNGDLLAVMPATNIGATDVQPQTLYQLVQRPKTGYQLAYGEYMSNPDHKALIKALPAITLPDGSTTRRGVDKRHFADIWKTMDPERKAVYQAAGAEALEALHVRIGMPTKRARGSEDDEDGEDGEGGSESGSRKKARRAGGGRGGGRKATTNLAKADITGVCIAGQFLHNKRWHIELASGVVLKVGKVFGSVNKAMGVKSAGAAKHTFNPFLLWKSAKAVATKAAQEEGTELAEEFAVAKYTELSPELKAKYVQMAADMKAAAAAMAPVSASGSDAPADASGEEEEEEEEYGDSSDEEEEEEEEDE